MAATRVADLQTLPQGLSAAEVEGEHVLLVRQGDRVAAFEGKCPHAGAPLEKGALCRGRIVCPWHMAAFDADTGAWLEPVALRGLARHEATVRDGAVHVALGPKPQPAAPQGDDLRVFVLAGAGAAAVTAALTLRTEGFAGRVVMVGPDPAEPLDRTVLSKMALGTADFDRSKLPLVPAKELARLRIERVTAAVTGLDGGARRLTLSTGATLGYDALLLATGGAPIPLDVPTSGPAYTLRTLADLDAILPHVRPGEPAVVIGSSFIGLEAASALAERKMHVTVVGKDQLPFAAIFGDRVGAALKALHEGKGIRFRLGADVASVEADAVGLASGERLPAALVVVGLGVDPVLDYAPGLDRAKDGGVSVDAGLRAADGIWAAGDIASPAGWPRIEHWRLAQQHGRVAAMGMLGRPASYGGVPFFWTAQGGKRLQALGHASGWDSVDYDGDVEAFDFIAWYVKDGAVQAALICGRDKAAAILSDALHRRLDLQAARAAVAE